MSTEAERRATANFLRREGYIAPRSPLEMMVDRACGLPDGWRDNLPVVDGRDADEAWLMLFCPICGRMQAVEREPLEPPAATALALDCPDCLRLPGAREPVPIYLAGDGQVLR